MTKKAIIYSDNFGQLTSLPVERMVKKLPPSLMAFGRITFVTASPGSYNHLLSLGSSFPLQLKEIKAVSPTQFAGEQPVFLPHSISRKNLLTRGFETIPDLWPKGSTRLGSQAFQLRKVADLWLGKQAVTSTHRPSQWLGRFLSSFSLHWAKTVIRITRQIQGFLAKTRMQSFLTGGSFKEAIHKRADTEGFHLHDVPREVKFMETGSRMVVAGDSGKGSCC